MSRTCTPTAAALLTILIPVGCGTVTGDDVATGAIEGSVVQLGSAAPIAGVVVSIGDARVHTAADGSFRIDQVQPGRRALAGEKNGFAPAAVYVEIEPGRVTRSTMGMDVIGPIRVQLSDPTPNSLVDDAFTLTATVHADYSLVEVEAEVDGIVSPLRFDPASGRWHAFMSIEPLASPSDRIIVIAAHDARGDSSRIAIPLRFDRRPALTVMVPSATDAVATPSLTVRAICVDDEPVGCDEVIVWAGTLLARAEGGRLDDDVSFADFTGRVVDVVIGGRDRSGQLDSVMRTVRVEPSPLYERVADGAPGRIVDADANRLLVVNSASHADTVVIVNRTTGDRTVLYDPLAGDHVPLGSERSQAALTPGGAVFLVGERNHPNLYEWRNGELATLARDVYDLSLVVAGDFAIWATNGRALFRRDLKAGVTLSIAGTPSQLNDVAPNGDVVFGGVFRYDEGTITAVGTGYAPVADTANTVYTRGDIPDGPFDIVLDHDGSETVLATNQHFQPIQRSHYLARGGWIAFTREDAGLVRQAWVRSPTGLVRQIAYFGAQSWIEDVGPDGSVVFKTVPGILAEGRRYRASPGGQTVEIGTALGQARFIAGQLHVMLGSALFRVNQ